MKIINYLLIIFFSVLIGSIIGEIILLFVPDNSFWHYLLSQYVFPGFLPKTWDINVLKISFGIFIKINIISIVAFFLSSIILLLREIY